MQTLVLANVYGRITQLVCVQSSVVPHYQNQPGLCVPAGLPPETAERYWVDPGDLTVKLRQSSVPWRVVTDTVKADNTEECVVDQLEPGTVVYWPYGGQDVVEDTELRFTLDEPGTYTLTLDGVSCLPQEVSFEAVA